MAIPRTIITTRAPAEVILIRILVGWVFLSEGIEKFLYPAEQAASRFERIPINQGKRIWILRIQFSSRKVDSCGIGQLLVAEICVFEGNVRAN
jgi:uncharacterized membrane protein YphA (DoxX/SURF4 family)